MNQVLFDCSSIEIKMSSFMGLILGALVCPIMWALTRPKWTCWWWWVCITMLFEEGVQFPLPILSEIKGNGAMETFG